MVIRPFCVPSYRKLKKLSIPAVKDGNKVAIAGDGQVTMGETTVMKHTAKKVRKLFGGKVVAGFAGSVADAFTLFEMFEAKLESCRGNLAKASVELAKQWRGDGMLRKLEALLIVADRDGMFVVSGGGEVIEPDYGIAAIGSGGNYAYAAARALKECTEMEPKEIAYKAIEIAGDICVYTNHHITVLELE